MLGQGNAGRWLGEVAAGQITQGCVAVLAGGLFRALAGAVAGIDPGHRQGNGQLRTHRLAVLQKIIPRRLQAVVHMQRQHLPGPALGARA